MESIVNFFGDIPTPFRAGILIGGIVLFWVLEGTLPLFQFQYKKVRHAGINLFFTLTTMIIGFSLAAALLAASNYVSDKQFGLLYLVDLPLWAQLVVGVLLLDLIGAYFVHWTEHKVKWMWKFHLVHHTDTTVDVTTGLRHHPGETVFRIGFTILAVIIVGAPMWIIMFYQSMSVLFAHITHANINMPKSVDRALSWVFITPLMHKVHHHYQQPLTDTNYGNIFSFWDRIFGTFAQVEDTTALKYGVDTHMDPKENDEMGNLLKIPFQPYRTPEDVVTTDRISSI
ncbi:sterol desaturase/sphingolipid hydroxylase (fatty acid hydroxylase superfamily) [Roseivirga pacifica]|uniref:Sterol desaturase/sphingolipid hydroxylase, fatty acid hydroxylase superfamily n=1 Tax=Roseivirga pacifica TaxID=1267423 RepID=A0A1I0P7L8_9BACT|nr:sterol desaturase family protein [Roseivirga pacifica]RKQ51773.1 sterol desaturase/sphingolipid hydroxylase (fatty acid hydroxylase superfamily) [Roseivirga pacifica]SEW10275.1 Sterol desaturase/sphingolipid hydroxylase, fatty acid hydroxylase superfamily [Roseivirga pacifica]